MTKKVVLPLPGECGVCLLFLPVLALGVVSMPSLCLCGPAISGKSGSRRRALAGKNHNFCFTCCFFQWGCYVTGTTRARVVALVSVPGAASGGNTAPMRGGGVGCECRKWSQHDSSAPPRTPSARSTRRLTSVQAPTSTSSPTTFRTIVGYVLVRGWWG